MALPLVVGRGSLKAIWWTIGHGNISIKRWKIPEKLFAFQERARSSSFTLVTPFSWPRPTARQEIRLPMRRRVSLHQLNVTPGDLAPLRAQDAHGPGDRSSTAFGSPHQTEIMGPLHDITTAPVGGIRSNRSLSPTVRCTSPGYHDLGVSADHLLPYKTLVRVLNNSGEDWETTLFYYHRERGRIQPPPSGNRQQMEPVLCTTMRNWFLSSVGPLDPLPVRDDKGFWWPLSPDRSLSPNPRFPARRNSATMSTLLAIKALGGYTIPKLGDQPDSGL